MKIIVFVSKTGDWLVSFVAAILATVMLLYGGYALWDTAMLYQGAFVSQNLMKYKPSVSVDGTISTVPPAFPAAEGS